MSDETLETLDNRVTSRIENINKIISTYETYILDTEDQESITSLQNDLSELQKLYTLESCPIFLADSDKKKTRFIMFLDRESILQKLNKIYENLSKTSYIISSKIELDKEDKEIIRKQSMEYNKNTIDIKIIKIDYDICEDCGNQMFHESITSEIKCLTPGCGLVKTLIGVSFESPKSQTNDAQLKKKKKYKHLFYSETQLKMIQCIVKKVPPQELVDQFLGMLKANHISNQDYKTIYVVRNHLKQLGAADQYKYAAYFRQKAINFEILRLSNEEHNVIMNMQKTCIIAYSKYDKKSKNCAHHLYILYKVMELPRIIRDDKKRKQLLSQIYMQSQKTLEKRDEIWKEICKELNLPFYKTERDKYANFY